MAHHRPWSPSLGLVLVFLCAAAQAGTFPVFGPRNYQRDTGSPVVVRESFTVAHVGASYVLRLANGGATGAFAQVTSAVVKVNGREVFSESDFNGRAPAVMERPIAVAATNELTIELRGNPGAGVTLTVLGEDNVPPTIAATVSPQPNAAGWNTDFVTVTFACADSMTAVTQCSAPVTVTAEGSTQVTGTAADSAGNTASKVVTVKIDKTPGSVAIASPAAGAAVAATSVDVSGNAADALSGLTAVLCNGLPASLSGGAFTCRVSLTAGPNSVTVVARDAAGNDTSAGLVVTSDSERPVVRILSPASGSTTNVSSLEIEGSAEDNDAVVEVKIGDAIVPVSGGVFRGTVALANGANSFVVSARDRAGNIGTASFSATRFALPRVAITSPADLTTIRTAAVTISGTVADAANVVVNGVPASVSGNTFTASSIPLAQGRTVVTATATSAGGAVATDSILVYRDAVPPRVVLRSPENNSTVFQAAVDVSGMIDDIVVGTVNSGQATIRVNGIAAEVANRAFIARNVPLTAGPNVLTIVATDQGGNTVTLTSNVHYDATARAKIAVVSGNGQSAVVGNLLPQPIVVKLTNADGTPAAGRAVTFEVIENNGMLAAGETAGRSISVTTGADGRSTATWVVGAHAGAGNNRVRAAAAGFGTVELQATGRLDAASLIVVDAGNAQYGAFGTPLPRPLIVAVVDPGSNRVPNVPVTFTVTEGEGSFDGASTVTVQTDSDGRAWVTPTLGQGPLNVFVASIPGSQSTATFQAFGKLAGAPAQTRISGIILDNTDLPIPGVSIRIDGSAVTGQSDDQGQFTLTGVPVGYVKLLVDGSTARRPGTWPTLEYAMYTIPGANNTLEMPIYLLPIDVRRGLFVDEVNGGTLTIPELPGFALTVKPGSATFPGGGRTGTVSVTMVHADKMPMAPGFGQQPRFIVTIQPPGVHFDPPAAISFPNVDGYAPGEVTEMYSFDHDLGQFVSIGTASVSANGAILSSDPGVGIIKGGWHCGGNPPAGGTPHCCPPCKVCQGGQCLEYSGHNILPGSGPHDFCCDGKQYSDLSNCCKAPQLKELTSKKFTSVADCPNWKPKTPPKPFVYSGCSRPTWTLPAFPGSTPNNPVAKPGLDFSGTQLSPVRHDLPCDKHDECYQTCHPNDRDQCDNALKQGMHNVCNANVGGADAFWVGKCHEQADEVYNGVHFFGWAFFDQEKTCDCC